MSICLQLKGRKGGWWIGKIEGARMGIDLESLDIQTLRYFSSLLKSF